MLLAGSTRKLKVFKPLTQGLFYIQTPFSFPNHAMSQRVPFLSRECISETSPQLGKKKGRLKIYLVFFIQK